MQISPIQSFHPQMTTTQPLQHRQGFTPTTAAPRFGEGLGNSVGLAFKIMGVVLALAAGTIGLIAGLAMRGSGNTQPPQQQTVPQTPQK